MHSRARSIDAHKIPCYPIIARSVSKWERLAALLRGHGGICAASPIIFRARSLHLQLLNLSRVGSGA
jgi:hypothetical protein